MRDKIKNYKDNVSVLNLFAYTGGATPVCAEAFGASVCHVDASKGMVSWQGKMLLCQALKQNL